MFVAEQTASSLVWTHSLKSKPDREKNRLSELISHARKQGPLSLKTGESLHGTTADILIWNRVDAFSTA